MKVRIEPDRINVMNYAERLTSVAMDEINWQRGSLIMTEVGEGIPTSTCLVPGCAMNACWV